MYSSYLRKRNEMGEPIVAFVYKYVINIESVNFFRFFNFEFVFNCGSHVLNFNSNKDLSGRDVPVSVRKVTSFISRVTKESFFSRWF